MVDLYSVYTYVSTDLNPTSDIYDCQFFIRHKNPTQINKLELMGLTYLIKMVEL
jgi:hypothetical protein